MKRHGNKHIGGLERLIREKEVSSNKCSIQERRHSNVLREKQVLLLMLQHQVG
jgi:hypothetical protein